MRLDSISKAWRPWTFVTVVLFASGLGVVPSIATAGNRVALVVGNSQYSEMVRLPNPVNDASDVSAALGRLGFDVTLLLGAADCHE